MRKCRLCNRPVPRLLLLVAVMFALGLALTPSYEKIRQLFGFQHAPGQALAQGVDTTRQVRVHLKSANAVDMAWAFYPKAQYLDVHPGAVNEVWFIAQNPTDKPMTAQAVPSIAPGAAAVYFHKTECFCFTQQVLQPGQRIEMPVRFIVDRAMPGEIEALTLGYTLFNMTPR